MFGEKYGDHVQVIEVPGYSIEFCGGTHCEQLGQIGMVRITGESAVGAGVRRIEGVTGAGAIELARNEHRLVRDLAEKLSARPDEIPARIASLQDELRSLQQQLDVARKAEAGDRVADLIAGAQQVEGVKLVANLIEVPDRKTLMGMADELREGLGSGVGVLAAVVDGKGALLVVVTDDLVGRGIKAGDLVKDLATIVGGTGGGRPHLAQAGTKDVDRLGDALTAAPRILTGKLG